MLLAGDVGATKTNLAVYSLKGRPGRPFQEKTFSSSDFSDLESLIDEFLSHVNVKIERAVLGVAGPVVEGQAKIVNLSWIIEKAKLERNLKLSSVRLLNDLEAIANAVPILEKSDQRTIHKGDPEENGTIAVIAPGTGLGEAFLVWDGPDYRAIPSEGGHADFAPADAMQTELLQYLREQFGHVSCERVCSGLGIPNIYTFLKAQKYAEEPAWLADKLAKTDDPTPVIVNAAQEDEKSCPLCVETIRLFVSILAAEAGNLALRVLATGGVYLGGGIPPRVLSFLLQPYFLEAFRDKGRLSDMMSRIPIHVILNPKAALFGAARVGFEMYK